MGARWLTDLADVCRRGGLEVIEVDGWQTRARGSGGYTAPAPDHVMIHHTASSPSSDPDGDVEYIAHNADAAPLANLYLSRSGEVWVIAAGATNTNGSGEDTWGGGVPVDQMNTHAIGIEAANNGTGEPWPDDQQAAYVALVEALCAAYGIPNSHVRGHVEWAPGRKIDPAGPSDWAGSGTWDMDAFRASCLPLPDPGPDPLPPPLEDDMDPFLIRDNVAGGVALVYGSGKVTGIDGTALPQMVDRFGAYIDVEPPTYQGFIDKSG